MKAIETRYKGYRFRSRLEARWAVFFDALGVDYEYEKEGYDFGDQVGKYLPDFWLPAINGGMWLEVKPTQENKESIVGACSKLRALVLATSHEGTIVYGQPADQGDGESIFISPEGCDTHYLFCVCPWCGKIGYKFDGRGARVCGYKTHFDEESAALAAISHMGHWRADDKCYTSNDPKLIDAAMQARSARFEHGEQG